MLNQRNWVVALVALLLMASLAGCAAAPVTLPEREVAISIDEALAGQNAGMAGLMQGKVEWTEAQFSSFLTELLKQNSGANNPVEGVTAWFSPDNQIALKIALKEGVLPFGNDLAATGKVMVQDGHLMVDLDSVGAGALSLSGPLADYASAVINRILADPAFGVAVDVGTGDGTISLGMAGM
jgi:hypothetical protein